MKGVYMKREGEVTGPALGIASADVTNSMYIAQVTVGYRYLSWDYENDGTVWDMAASGPYLGLGIKF